MMDPGWNASLPSRWTQEQLVPILYTFTTEVQKYGFCLDSSDSLSAKELNALNLDLSEANTD
jgi:hypothetical protein